MQITPVSVEKARELVEQEGAIILDIRSRRQFEAIHIDGSIFDSLCEGCCDPLSNCKGKPVIFTCVSGGRTRIMGKALAKRAEDAGCSACYYLDGGYVAWKAKGYPMVESEKPEIGSMPSPSILRQVQFTAGFLAAGGAILSLLAHPWFAAIPIFVGCGLIFASLTGFCGMAQLLLLMPWNRDGAACPCSGPSKDKEQDCCSDKEKDKDGDANATGATGAAG